MPSPWSENVLPKSPKRALPQRLDVHSSEFTNPFPAQQVLPSRFIMSVLTHRTVGPLLSRQSIRWLASLGAPGCLDRPILMSAWAALLSTNIQTKESNNSIYLSFRRKTISCGSSNSVTLVWVGEGLSTFQDSRNGAIVQFSIWEAILNLNKIHQFRNRPTRPCHHEFSL
jgi:hypothetical protein